MLLERPVSNMRVSTDVRWSRAAVAVGVLIGCYGYLNRQLGNNLTLGLLALSSIFLASRIAAPSRPTRAISVLGAVLFLEAVVESYGASPRILGAASSSARYIVFAAIAAWFASISKPYIARKCALVSGAVCSLGIFFQALTGHAFIALSDKRLVYMGATGPSGLRMWGFQPSPNEAAALLSIVVLISLIPTGLEDTLRRRLLVAAPLLAALYLTGSRSSIIAVIAGACICLTMNVGGSGRLSARSVALGFTFFGSTLVLILSDVRVFGRSLNVFASEDASTVYRRAVQRYLFENIDWMSLGGAGYIEGNQLSPTTLAVGMNIDQAFLYMYLGLGWAGVLLFLSILVMLARSAEGPFRACAVCAVWLVVVGSAENLTSSTSVMALLPALVRTAGHISARERVQQSGGINAFASAK